MSSPVQVSTALSVSAVAVAKPQTVSPGSPGNNPASPAVLQGVTSPNIKQVNQLLSASMFGHLSYSFFSNLLQDFLVVVTLIQFETEVTVILTRH